MRRKRAQHILTGVLHCVMIVTGGVYRKVTIYEPVDKYEMLPLMIGSGGKLKYGGSKYGGW